MGGWRIGTCGYDYLDWKGSFYPPELSRGRFLEYYATQFDALEINHSYYRMPEADQLISMADRAGPTMLFSIKANDLLTHRIDPSSWRAAATLFKRAIEPLAVRGQLSAILFQFPASFPYEPAQRVYLGELLADFEAYPRVVEFRHSRWVSNRVIEGLRERGVAYSCTDLPDLPNLPAPAEILCAEQAYVRFHGRNAASFWGSDAAARFDYYYNDTELAAWVLRIKHLALVSKQVLVFFNNHRNGQAPRNAQRLAAMLAES
jgi:uncharacterized protein YecE (DUF72 family)